jgi:hypothetical protein
MQRHIEQKMIEFIDKKLEHNGLAQEATRTKNARALMLCAAQACVGIREEGGNNRGPLVTLIQETVGGPDHVAWCMSFVQTCIAYAELKTGVKSPIPAGEHCLTIWQTSPKEQRVKLLPLAGAIVIYQHGHSSSGHTGLVESTDGNTVWNYEGNTESGVALGGKIERDGGGVYHTHRPIQGVGDMHLLGFLKPF